jgi:hypothetical protein
MQKFQNFQRRTTKFHFGDIWQFRLPVWITPRACKGLIPAKFVPRWLTDEQEQRQFLAAKTELCYPTLACHFASIVIFLVSDNETAAVRASLPECSWNWGTFAYILTRNLKNHVLTVLPGLSKNWTRGIKLGRVRLWKKQPVTNVSEYLVMPQAANLWAHPRINLCKIDKVFSTL